MKKYSNPDFKKIIDNCSKKIVIRENDTLANILLQTIKPTLLKYERFEMSMEYFSRCFSLPNKIFDTRKYQQRVNFRSAIKKLNGQTIGNKLLFVDFTDDCSIGKKEENILEALLLSPKDSNFFFYIKVFNHIKKRDFFYSWILKKFEKFYKKAIQHETKFFNDRERMCLSNTGVRTFWEIYRKADKRTSPQTDKQKKK